MENSNNGTLELTDKQLNWSVDTVHSNLKFSVSHLVISEVEGEFKNYSATISSNEDFSDLNVLFEIEVDSLSTNNDMRDGHLKSDDFFNAEKYPKIIFSSTQLEKISDTKFILKGDLKIREVSLPIDLNVQYKGQTKDAYGNVKAAFKISGSINRFQYGLKWTALTEAGGLVVGQDVSFSLNLQLQKIENI